MITKQTLKDFAQEFNLPINTVEKDYVLGWLLAGIAHDDELFNKWIFKGGTCLKKCFFETYRFSEDLDYTLVDKNHVNKKFLITRFKKMSDWVYEETGIKILEDTIRFEIYHTSNGKTAIEGSLNYIGPLQRKNNPYRIKLDLTAEEVLINNPKVCEVHHPYPDRPTDGIKTYCYEFPELFAEKIRALGDRARPRDLYDVIHLFRHAFPEKNANSILEILRKKCDYKNLLTPTFKLLVSHPKLQELESEWSNMLAHQVPLLPNKNEFWNELPHMFNWLHGNKIKLIRESIPFPLEEKINLTWKPPSMITKWGFAIPLESIRYAGSNHLCIKIEYQNENYLIEPYDLKQTIAKKILLIGVNHLSDEIHTFNVHKITKIEVVNTVFVPKYLIALTPLKNN